jgi:Flp pilus assembly pilin Flp
MRPVLVSIDPGSELIDLRKHMLVPPRNVLRPLVRFVRDEQGQDNVEYALLTAIIAIAAIAVLNALTVRVGQVYGAADAGVQNLSACTPDPGQVSCTP